MARRTWVLDTDTKGTGANMVPLEKVLKQPERPAERPARPREAAERHVDAAPERRERRRRRPDRPETTATPLPLGHVRKLSTGEIGKVQAVDARAGTATVHWFKRGSVSTVPLSAVSRR
jgi:hypothetical protein